jgi:hypothetical protein
MGLLYGYANEFVQGVMSAAQHKLLTILGGGSSVTSLYASQALPSQTIASAIISGTKTIRLGPGTFTLETALAAAEGATDVRIIGSGDIREGTRATILTPGFAGSGPDVYTNAMMSFRGVLNTTSVNTTIASTARRFDETIVVASVANITAGMWLELRGNNFGDDQYGASDALGIMKTEVVQVKNVTGTTVTLTRPLGQQHGVGMTVKRVTPPLRVTIQNVHLAGADGSVAVGLLFEDAVGVVLDRISASGWSRAGWEAIACDVMETNCYNAGSNMATSFYRSTSPCIRGRDFDPTGVPGAQAGGVQRGDLTMRERCWNVLISPDCRFGNSHCGILSYGGMDETIAGWCVNNSSHVRRVSSPEVSAGDGRIGAGISVMDASDITTYGEYPYNLTVACTIVDAETYYDPALATPREMGAQFIDVRGLKLNDLTIINSGRNETVIGSRWRNGIGFKDCFDVAGRARTIGCANPGYFYGFCYVDLESWDQDANNGQATASGSMWFGETKGSARIRIRSMRSANFQAALSNGDTFADPNRDVVIDSLWLDNGVRFSCVTRAYDGTGEALGTGEGTDAMNSAGDLTLTDHATVTGENKAISVQTQTNASWGFAGIVGSGPQSAKASAAIAIGVQVEMAAPGGAEHRMVGNAASVRPLGRALTGASGANALFTLGNSQ